MYKFDIPQYVTVNRNNFVKHDVEQTMRSRNLGAIKSSDMQRQHFRLGYEPSAPDRFEQHYINWRSPTPVVPSEPKTALQLNQDPFRRETTP